jgi:hypothetical protein
VSACVRPITPLPMITTASGRFCGMGDDLIEIGSYYKKSFLLRAASGGRTNDLFALLPIAHRLDVLISVRRPIRTQAVRLRAAFSPMPT